MYVITGGAGFIGSNIGADLDEAGAAIVISDRLGEADHKWRKIAKRRLFDLVQLESTLAFLNANRGKVHGFVRFGRRPRWTSTPLPATIRLSIDVWPYCAAENIPFV